MSSNVLLLSIHPKHAKKILDGTKTVELRKAKPRITTDDWVLVYAASPIKAIIGMFQVAGIVEDSPKGLWSQVADTAAITRSEYDAYYRGATRSTGIFVGQWRSLQTPIKLECLKETWVHFHPPQSFRYLDFNQLSAFAEVTRLMHKNKRF